MERIDFIPAASTGFGAIVTKDMRVYFIEPDDYGDVSHRKLIRRLKWNNNMPADYVRVGCWDWTIETFTLFDPVPGWAEAHKDEIKVLVERTVAICAQAYKAFARIVECALIEYERAKFNEKLRKAALEDYDNIYAMAKAEMISAMSKVDGYIP